MLGDMRVLRKLTSAKPTVTPVNTSPYTVLITDQNIYVDAIGAPIIVNLPPATGSGRMIVIKKVDASANLVTPTVDTTGTPDTIDGDPTFPLVYPWASITLQDGAANVWYVQ